MIMALKKINITLLVILAILFSNCNGIEQFFPDNNFEQRIDRYFNNSNEFPQNFDLKKIYPKTSFDEAYLIRGPMSPESSTRKMKLKDEGNKKMIYDDHISLFLLQDKKIVYRSDNFDLELKFIITNFDLDEIVYKIYPNDTLEVSTEVTEFGKRYKLN